MNEKGSEKAACCTQRCLEITHADLPLACPPLTERVWDGHPRVYLPIDAIGKVTCPYCGTEYVLKDFAPREKSPIYNLSE